MIRIGEGLEIFSPSGVGCAKRFLQQLRSAADQGLGLLGKEEAGLVHTCGQEGGGK